MAKSPISEERISLIFAAHPHQNQLHFTADDQAFYKMNDAKAHADSLADKYIEIIARGGKIIAPKKEGEKPAKPIEVIVDQEDLDNNPGLEDQGDELGKTLEIEEPTDELTSLKNI